MRMSTGSFARAGKGSRGRGVLVKEARSGSRGEKSWKRWWSGNCDEVTRGNVGELGGCKCI